MGTANIFTDFNRQLGSLLEKRLDPQTQLGFQQVDINEQRFAQNEAIRGIISNASVDGSDPSSITNLFENLSSIDPSFLGQFVASAQTERDTASQLKAEQRQLVIEQRRLDVADELSQQFSTTRAPKTAAIIKAESVGIKVPTDIVSRAIAGESITPQDELDFAELAKFFTSPSVSAFRTSLDQGDLVPRPEQLKRLEGTTGGRNLTFTPVTPAQLKDQRDVVSKTPVFEVLVKSIEEKSGENRLFGLNKLSQEDATDRLFANIESTGISNQLFFDMIGRLPSNEEIDDLKLINKLFESSFRGRSQATGQLAKQERGIGADVSLEPAITTSADFQQQQSEFMDALTRLESIGK